MAMAAKKKQAKFFCEFCDTEVPFNARFCPKCGHFFLAVRCPACGKTGDQDEFTNGCPQCGYAFDGSPVKPFITPKTDDSANTKKTSQKNLFQKREFSSYTDTNSKKRKNDDALPAWIYIATFAVFAGIVAFIITQCRT